MQIKTGQSDQQVSLGVSPELFAMLHHHRVVVVVPAFNEDRFIGSVVLKILQFPLTVIVVDDGSTDATALVAQAAGALVLRHDCNQGKGVALNTGISHARKMSPEAIVIIDADGQHLVRELPGLVRPILEEQADIVVGSRYLDQFSPVPPDRHFGHWFFNNLTGLVSRVKVTDSQSGYRAFSPRAFNADLFLSRNFSVESEMQFLAHEYGLRVAEVPVSIRYTDKPKRSVISHGMSVLAGVIKLTGQYRPLIFFSLPGTITMLAGLMMGLLVVERFGQRSELAVGYAMISVLLSVIGIVLFSTGIILHSVRDLLSDMLHRNEFSKGRKLS